MEPLEFQLHHHTKNSKVTIDEVATDKFSGWSLGTLEVLDNVDEYIDGQRKDFPLFLNTERISIVSAKGSRIRVQDVLLVFVNDILQVPENLIYLRVEV